MKSAAGKYRKPRPSGGTKPLKPACGTLSYLAECRGAGRKSGPAALWQEPAADTVSRIVRKHSAER